MHVNRTLQALGADGLISRTKRDIGVADWSALADVGDFDAKYLHVESAQGHGPPPAYSGAR